MAFNDMIDTTGATTGLSLKNARLLNAVLLEDGTIAVHDGLTWSPVRLGAGTVETVADATARAALTPDAGDICFQDDTNVFYIYDGAAWAAIPSASLTVQNAGVSAQTAVDTFNVNIPGYAAAAGAAGVVNVTRQAAIAITGQTTLAVWRRYTLATSGGGFKLLVPASPAAGDEIEVIWKSGDMSDNPILIRNNADDATLFTWGTDATTGTLVYDGAAWRYHAKLWS